MKQNHFIAAIVLIFSLNVSAQDRLFNYTYQSGVLNKGQKEIEVWTTVLSGKDDYYREIQNRVEYEVGLGSNLQVAFYLNSKQRAAFDAETSSIEMVPTEISVSNEWKYKFSDAVASPIGFAAYLEFTVATDELEIELKAILDKKIGRATHALNLTFEPEWETQVVDGKVENKVAYKYDVNYGFSYNLNKNWNLGAELVNQNVNIPDEKFTHSALFAGPTLGFNMDKFWINLSVAPQITGFNTGGANSSLNLDEFTKLSSRFVFSYTF